MEKLIYYPVFNERAKCKFLDKQIKDKLYNNLSFTDNIDKANVILVWGWDGFMLDTIKQYMHLNKIFLGINCGTLGFLLNPIDDIRELPENTKDINIVEETTIRTTVTDMKWNKKTQYGINDIAIWGNILDWFNIKINGESIQEEIQWTWLLISTPIWSTAYWLKMWWPLLPLKSNLWWILGIWTRPFNYKVLEPEEITIDINGRSPVITWVDGYGGKIDDVREVKLDTCNQTVKIWFVKWQQFETKRVMMASKIIG